MLRINVKLGMPGTTICKGLAHQLHISDNFTFCEDRYQLRSTILTSQIPVKRWHEQIGDPTLADSILDRLVHNAHQIELQGKSARRELNGKDGKGS